MLQQAHGSGSGSPQPLINVPNTCTLFPLTIHVLACAYAAALCCRPLQTFMETLQQARDSGALSPSVLAVLGRVCCLFGLGLVEAGAGDLLEAGWMTGGFCGLRVMAPNCCKGVGSMLGRVCCLFGLGLVEAGAGDLMTGGQGRLVYACQAPSVWCVLAKRLVYACQVGRGVW
jgi:hypothetical protein